MYIFIIDVIKDGIAVPAERTGDTKEKKVFNYMVPWIVSKIENNSELLLNLNDPCYRDKSTSLMRLYQSACYAVKSFLVSTVTVFRSPEGLGFECGLFGISMTDRAELKSDQSSIVHQEE